jgi:hypothetical protein
MTKGKIVLLVNTHHAIKTYAQWQYTSTYTLPRQWIQFNGQFHVTADLSLVSTGLGWGGEISVCLGTVLTSSIERNSYLSRSLNSVVYLFILLTVLPWIVYFEYKCKILRNKPNIPMTVCLTETLVPTYKYTRRHKPEDQHR